jgi:hypothetical protein
LDEFSRQIGKELRASTIPIGQAVVTVDGFFKEGDFVILAEAWAHIGKAKSAQRNKVLGDLLKLAFISSVLKRSYPTVMVESNPLFADNAAASAISGKSWASLAAREFGIKTMVVALSDQVIEAIKEAQRKQDIRIV